MRQDWLVPQPTNSAARPATTPSCGLRAWLRSTPGLRQLYRLGVFVAGALFVVLGAVLSVLPGPLTIPPVLLGLWIWSMEFRWARRLFDAMRARGERAWRHARAHAVSSALTTVAGLLAAGVAVWVVQHYDLLGRARDWLLP